MLDSILHTGVSLLALCSFIRLSSFDVLTLTLRFILRCLLVRHKVVEDSPNRSDAYLARGTVIIDAFLLFIVTISDSPLSLPHPPYGGRGFLHACFSHIYCLISTQRIDMSPQFCYAPVQV